MADIQQTRAQLIDGAPDNTQRLISPQKYRNFIESALGFVASFDPTPQDDADNTAGNGFFDAGSTWLNVSGAGDFLWKCFSGAHNAADWRLIYPAPAPPPPGDKRTTFTASFSANDTDPQSGLYPMGGGTPAAGDLVLVVSTAGHVTANQGPWIAGSGAWTRPDWYASGATLPCSPLVQLQQSPFSLPLSVDGLYFAGEVGSPIFPIVVDSTPCQWGRASANRLQMDTDGHILVDGVMSSRKEAATDPTFTFTLNSVPAGLVTGAPWLTSVPNPIPMPPIANPGGVNNLYVDNVTNQLTLINNAGVAFVVGNWIFVDVAFGAIVPATLTTGYIKLFSLQSFALVSFFQMHTVQTWGITTNTSSISVIFDDAANTPPAGEQLLWSFGATTLNEWRFPPGGVPQWTWTALTGGGSERAWNIYLKITESGGIANVNRGRARFFCTLNQGF